MHMSKTFEAYVLVIQVHVLGIADGLHGTIQIEKDFAGFIRSKRTQGCVLINTVVWKSWFWRNFQHILDTEKFKLKTSLSFQNPSPF